MAYKRKNSQSWWLLPGSSKLVQKWKGKGFGLNYKQIKRNTQYICKLKKYLNSCNFFVARNAFSAATFDCFVFFSYVFASRVRGECMQKQICTTCFSCLRFQSLIQRYFYKGFLQGNVDSNRTFCFQGLVNVALVLGALFF